MYKQKLIQETPSRAVTGNMSDKELARQIEHEFPNLKGSLKQMFDRFEQRASGYLRQPDLFVAPVPHTTEHLNCPECGTKLKLVAE